MKERSGCVSMVCGAAYVPMSGARQMLTCSASSLAILTQVINAACVKFA